MPEHVKESEQVCTRASGGPPLHPPCVSCPGFLETDSWSAPAANGAPGQKECVWSKKAVITSRPRRSDIL